MTIHLESIHTRWGEHPDFTHADWADEACADETRLGYWDWVQQQIDIAEESDDE